MRDRHHRHGTPSGGSPRLSHDSVPDNAAQPADPCVAERVELEPVRSGPGRRFMGRAPIGDEWDAGVERVGGRRRIRGEIVVLVVGAVFVAGALLKPWPNARPVPRPSAAPTTAPSVLIAEQSSGPAAPARTMPPSERRTNEPRPDSSLPSSLGDYFGGWDSVDWSALNAADPHAVWGISTASLPGLVPSRNASRNPALRISWQPTGSPTSAATVTVDRGRTVFAFAITWPSGVEVSEITVNYVGARGEPPYIASGGFPPFTELSPLPAAEVTAAPVALRTGSEIIESGQFWVAPAQASPIGGLSSPARAWRILPWPWPMGDYKVTVTSKRGAETMVLRLEERA